MKQEEALKILKMGHSVYLTGEAGSGKTYVIDKYISWLKKRGIRSAVTASTGIAATHLGGSTIHSWSGIGIKDRITSKILDQMEQKKNLYARFEDTDILIIDEISMLSSLFIDMLDLTARHMKRSPGEPFGGMQVVFSGDFFQLPPVEKSDYAFSSRAWEELCPVVCYLNEQHRHGDQTLLEILSAIRRDDVKKSHRELLDTKSDQIKGEHLRLFTHNIDVDRINSEHLKRIKSKDWTFEMIYKGNKSRAEALIRGCLAPDILKLKKGAKVMFVKNDNGGQYVNGTQGMVVDFKNGIPIVLTGSGRKIPAEHASWKFEEDGKVLAEIRQIPLRLAWAITVHKSQGMTLDEAEMDLSQCFVPGQGYVALSRLRSLEGLYLRGINSMALRIDPRVVKADVVFRKRSELARARLTEFTDNELEKRQRSFVSSHGGIWEGFVKKRKVSTLDKTRELLLNGWSIQKVAEKRGLTVGVIVKHAEKLLSEGVALDFSSLAPNPDLYADIENAGLKHGLNQLSPIKKELEKGGHRISYDKLRLARLFFLSLSKGKYL